MYTVTIEKATMSPAILSRHETLAAARGDAEQTYEWWKRFASNGYAKSICQVQVRLDGNVIYRCGPI